MCNKTLITPPESQNNVNRERYGSLDGLRAYAALGIVLMHVQANICVKPSANYVTGHLIPFFTDFTLLFMVVSGFSLCCGYYGRIKSGAITPSAFYRKRYLRILPFFALMSLIDFAAEPGAGTLCEVFSNMTLCFGLLPADTEFHVIGVGWFLGVVFLFYMLFPFFVFMLDNRRRAWLSFALALVFVLVSFVHFGAPGRRCMVFCAPLFLVGGLAYMYRHGLAEFGRRHLWPSAAGAVVLTVCYFAFSGTVHDRFIRYLLELALFALWLAYAVGSKDRFLNNRVAKYLSAISMEIYLSHMLVYRVLERAHLESCISQNDALYTVTSLLTIAGVVCFAHVTKYYVVQPLVNRIEKR